MDALVCFILLCLAWLTVLTFKLKNQVAQNKIIESNNKYYIREIKKLKQKLYDKE